MSKSSQTFARLGWALKTLPVLVLAGLTMVGCSKQTGENFAHAAPEAKIVSPFPLDGTYSSSPNGKVILRSGSKGLSGFDLESAKMLWELPVVKPVGLTEQNIVAYREQPSTVEFVAPLTGEVERRVAPAPLPLTGKNSVEQGMAFTDDVFLTTKALYTNIWDGNSPDPTYAIGVTAKTWGQNEIKWFAPPVRQIVILESRPRLIGDKVLVLSPKGGVNGPQSAQILSLATGKQLSRLDTPGEFYDSPGAGLVERTPTFVRRLDPLSGSPLWTIKGDFTNGVVFEVGAQLTLATPHADKTRSISIVSPDKGAVLAHFDLPFLQETPLTGCYLRPDKTVLLHFFADPRVDIARRDFDYWVDFDTDKKLPLWRTEFYSHSASSLLPLIGDRLEFQPAP